MSNINTRKISYEILYDIFQEDAYSNITLNKYFNKYKLEEQDKRFISEVVYGTIKNKMYLEHILKNYSNHEFIKIIDKQNGGLSSVRNLSMDLCDTDYLWMIDVDDEIEENSLVILSRLRLGEINVFNYRTFDSLGNFKFHNKCVKAEQKTTIYENKEFLLFDTASWHYVFKTTFLKQKGIQFLNNKLYEDFNWNLKILKEANEICTFKESIYKYYFNNLFLHKFFCLILAVLSSD